jgi:hypothetical protein
MVLALFILFGSRPAATVTTSTARVFRVVVGTSGALTHLVPQCCASEATCNGAQRPQKGTRGSARNTSAHGSYSFTSVNASRVGSGTVPIVVVVFSHPSHSLVLR